MTWSYEIRYSNYAIAAMGKGFDTYKAAMAAGRKKARELKASGSLPDGGIATVKAQQDSKVLVPVSRKKDFLDKELMAAKVDTQ
jgi:hypothetical protein